MDQPSPRLEILFEDPYLLFVNKPAGIVVQRGYDADEPVLLERVNEYLFEKGEPGILMQRLDRGTSGVLFFSKDPTINRNLTRQFEQKTIIKTYLAIAEGEVLPQRIDAPLLRVGPISFGVRPAGKRSITNVSLIEQSNSASFLEIGLLTGRTHQIRVHLAAIGHPLAGDWLYGQRNESRPMLHARRLQMKHPKGGEPISVIAPIPDDFLQTLLQRGLSSGQRDLGMEFNRPFTETT